jgi:hypothetical protein
MVSLAPGRAVTSVGSRVGAQARGRGLRGERAAEREKLVAVMGMA